MADRPPLTITIDGIAYPCSSWQTSSAARALERRYDSGFNGGMGFFTERQQTAANQIYHCVNLDPTTFPYIRMRKGEENAATQILELGSETDADVPAYGFVADDGSGNEYLYILNKRKAFKIDLTTSPAPSFAGGSVAAATRTVESNAIAGRPVLFEGKWRIPWGASGVAETLTTVGTGAIANDTWNNFSTSDNALHFASTISREGVAQLWMADATNQMSSTASVGTAFAPTTGFEIGDSSLPITDLLTVQGELFISKPDKPYRMDDQGSSIGVLEFVGATGDILAGFPSYDGANAGEHGPYAYWPHSSGLWRIWGDSATPVDPMSQQNWTGGSWDSLTPSFNQYWMGFAAWGRWAYAINAADGVYAGWINNDGIVTWMGNIISATQTSWTARMRCGISAATGGPILWLMDESKRFAVFRLEWDGSMRGLLTDGVSQNDRGGKSEKGQIWMPGTDLGEPEKQKQLRMGWLTLDNNAYTNLAVEMRIHRDRAATSTQMGSDLDSSSGDGQFEFVMTPGTNDTFREAMLALRFDTTDTSVAVTGTDIAFVDGGGGADTITQTAAGFGIFAANDRITVSGGSDNNGTYTIVSVVAATITLATGSLPNAPEGAGDSVTITREFNTDKADPRIRSMGFRAVTPHTYTAIIPADKDHMTGSLGVKDAKIKLEALKSSEGVPVREPGFNTEFTGYIKDVQLRVIDAQDGQIDYIIEVTIDRWVL